jgi:hypothetical protein
MAKELRSIGDEMEEEVRGKGRKRLHSGILRQQLGK